MRSVVLLSVLSVIASGCAGGPTAPSSTAERPTVPSATSTHGNLTMISAGISRVQDAPGNWQYKVTVRLRETGGVDMTVTHLQAQDRYGSDIRGTASDSPMLSVSANSSGDAELFFPRDTRVENLSTLTVDITVQFRDAHGNTGSVSNLFNCFSCWDY